MLPTLRSVLELPSVRRGKPHLLAGAAGLDRAVRWVHVSEARDGASLLEGGELVLSTGLALTNNPDDVASYVHELIDAGARGLMIELSRAFPSVPQSATQVADELGFPLVVLERSTKFVAVTEEVNRRIIAERLDEVTFGQHVHEVFTHLSLEDATPLHVVRAVAELTGSSVVLEDLRHHVIAHASVDQTDAHLLSNWAARSRLTTSTAGDDDPWINQPVGRRGQTWAHLIVPDSTGPSERVPVVLQRAAQALELGRMVERDHLNIELQAQGGFLQDLMDGVIGDSRDAEARAHSLGLPLAGNYLPVAVTSVLVGDPGSVRSHRHSRQLVERVNRAVREANVPSLVGPMGLGSVGLLVAVSAGRREQPLLDKLASAIHRSADDARIRIGVDDGVSDLLDAASGLRRAQHVASVADGDLASDKPYYRHVDVRLRGLMSLLHDDPRVQAFAEAELQRILVHDSETGAGFLDLLRGFLDAGGNKTELARTSHQARPGLYRKLARIEGILGVKLDDPASRTSLSVAILAHDLGQANQVTGHRP